MKPSTVNLTTTAGQSQSGQPASTSALGFGDLCRYFYRTLKEDSEDYTAHDVMDKDFLAFVCIGYFVACLSHD